MVATGAAGVIASQASDAGTAAAPVARQADAGAPIRVVKDCPPRVTGAVTRAGKDRLSLVRARFAQLPGWRSDKLSEAVPPFVRSCNKLDAMADSDRIGAGPFGGVAKDWREACKAARRVPAGDDAAARAFFERHFAVYAAHGSKGPQGTFTGYYVQQLRASRRRGGPYQFPLWEKPRELIKVELNEFVDDGRGRTLWGMVDPLTKQLVPYPTRKRMRQRNPRPKVLVWADDPVDAFAIEIEGSGVAKMKDGSTQWIHFAGKNGQTGTGLRATVRRVRRLKRRLRRIRRGRHTHSYYRATDPKKSIVFFRFERRKGAIGTQDVILTPQRSLAVDRAVIPLSTPVFVATKAPTGATGPARPWRQLLIAQDTGGAIVGPIRGDIYWGADATAAAIGRRMFARGKAWLLLPKGIAVKTKSR